MRFDFVPQCISLYEDISGVGSISPKEKAFHYRRPEYGKKLCTRQRDDRFIVACILGDWNWSLNILAQRLGNVRKPVVSSKTTRIMLRENGLMS